MRLRSRLSHLVAVAAPGYVCRHGCDASLSQHHPVAVEGVTLVSAPSR